MRKLVRSVLIALLAFVLLVGGVVAYRALTGNVSVQVQEPLSFVGSNSIDIGGMYPTESRQETFTVANAAPNDIEIDLSYVIIPDPTGKGFSVAVPNKTIVLGAGQVSFDVSVTATKSAVPGNYMIEFYIDR